jgi:uncharacterized coiled-coil protein SlyX
MPVSNSELRIMLNLQARGDEVVARMATQLENLRKLADSIGQTRGFTLAQQQVKILADQMQKTAQQTDALGKAVEGLSRVATRRPRRPSRLRRGSRPSEAQPSRRRPRFRRSARRPRMRRGRWPRSPVPPGQLGALVAAAECLLA